MYFQIKDYTWPGAHKYWYITYVPVQNYSSNHLDYRDKVSIVMDNQWCSKTIIAHH